MYPDLFHGLGLKQSDLQPYDAPLVGFSGKSIRPSGKIMLNVHTGLISLKTEFLVVDVPSPYTAIMGWHWLHKLKAIPFSFHQKLCFPTDYGVMEIKGDHIASKQCIMAAIKQNPPWSKQKRKVVAERSKGLSQLEEGEDAHPKSAHETFEPCEDLESVLFSSEPEKYF